MCSVYLYITQIHYKCVSANKILLDGPQHNAYVFTSDIFHSSIKHKQQQNQNQRNCLNLSIMMIKIFFSCIRLCSLVYFIVCSKPNYVEVNWNSYQIPTKNIIHSYKRFKFINCATVEIFKRQRVCLIWSGEFFTNIFPLVLISLSYFFFSFTLPIITFSHRLYSHILRYIPQYVLLLFAHNNK